MLEAIVRPWQNPGALATQRIVSSNRQVSAGVAELIWGQAGGMPTPVAEEVQTGGGIKTLACCKDVNTEQDRQTEKVKVTNPNDPTQFVIVERVTQIAFGLDRTNVCFGESSETARALAEFDASFDTGTTGTEKPGQCKASFTLKNH
jgi:hypothetical protein